MKHIIDILRGIVLNPVLTAFARGLAEAVAFLILYSVADFALALPDLHPLLLVAMPTLIRTAEGYVDKIDAAKQRQRDTLRSYVGAPADGELVRATDVRG